MCNPYIEKYSSGDYYLVKKMVIVIAAGVVALLLLVVILATYFGKHCTDCNRDLSPRCANLYCQNASILNGF